ncbi:glycosyltransferase family 2 protein [Flavihumibacter sp.]|uniref:glycosyltransferase family 2 protein n=1 Tax=Flavihumibacter sp. TaxID=1913981 RepID=UPI002FC5C422
MKITGFTIIKNAVINDYPIVEAIRSILPIVDEMIVLVGDSTDDTEALIRSINSDKIRIHHSVWDKSLQKGGFVLADETNKAFDLVGADSDWAFYIQGDECIHEKYHASILEAAKRHLADRRVDGLLFNYLHFYGTYDYVGDSRKWYDKEVRLIRNDKSIRAYRDAQGFRRNGEKIRVKPAHAWVYHYGWVKSAEQMKEKVRSALELWQERKERAVSPVEVFDVNDYDSLKRFTGTHPAVMKERLATRNWDMQFDLSRNRMTLKNRVLYAFEKLTGRRLFAFRNYRLT